VVPSGGERLCSHYPGKKRSDEVLSRKRREVEVVNFLLKDE
jgi:hypothetical protein